MTKEVERGASCGYGCYAQRPEENEGIAKRRHALVRLAINIPGNGDIQLRRQRGRCKAGGIPAGDAIDEQLAKRVRDRYPDAQFTIHMIRQWKERWSFVGEARRRVMVTAPIRGRATEFDITEEMRTACESILPPMYETMFDLLAQVEPEFQEKLRNNVILAGGGSLIGGLREAIEKALEDVGGGKVTLVHDPVFAGSDGGLAIARDASNTDWERLAAW